jgi:hypothetical protein
MIGLACVIGLTLGLYFLGAGIYDLCYGIGPIRPEGCASGGSLEEQDSSLVAIGILLAVPSVIVLASVVKRRGSFESSVWIAWFVRSVFVVGISSGILMFFGSGSGICDPFGPFGTTGKFCTSFDPYEAIGPLLTLISLVGLVYSFRTTSHQASSGHRTDSDKNQKIESRHKIKTARAFVFSGEHPPWFPLRARASLP